MKKYLPIPLWVWQTVYLVNALIMSDLALLASMGGRTSDSILFYYLTVLFVVSAARKDNE